MQYIREVASKNVSVFKLIPIAFVAFVNYLHRRLIGGHIYPFIDANLLLEDAATPAIHLELQPGEYVRIKKLHEILSTLNTNYRNRGLYFDREMIRYCGKEARVLKRVKKIIDEATGEIIEISNDCIILEGVVCCGDLSSNRLLCPRSIYPYWREIWLERV